MQIGGSGSINGVASSNQAFTVLNVARDTGTLNSAYFHGYVKINNNGDQFHSNDLIYRNGSNNYWIANRQDRSSILHNNADYKNIQEWRATKSGRFRTTFSALITTGPYYFRYRFYNVTSGAEVKMADGTTNANHFYSANQVANDGNVHHWQHYQLDLGNIRAGDVIQIQIAPSNNGGVVQTGNSTQYGQVKRWKIFSAIPSTVERNNGIAIRPNILGPTRSFQDTAGSAGSSHAYTLRVPFTLGSGTHELFKLLNNSQDTVASAKINYTGLYAYAGTNMAIGEMAASIRRVTNNSAWGVTNHTLYHNSSGGSVSTPSFAWTTSGTLQIIIAGSVQITGELAITIRNCDDYEWGSFIRNNY